MAAAWRDAAIGLPRGRRLQASARCVGRALDARSALAVWRAAGARKGAAGGYSAPTRGYTRAGRERRSGADLDRPALLDEIPRSGHRVLHRRGTNRARDAPTRDVCARAPRAAQLLRSGVSAVMGRARGARTQPDHGTIRARLRGRCARKPCRLAVVLPALALEKAALRR